MTTTRSPPSPPSADSTRRFLGHLGAVGGSSLVMTASLSSWDLMAGVGRANVRRSPACPRNARVLVLGVAASRALRSDTSSPGLATISTYSQARDRVGGLVWTVRRGATHIEIGGERQQCTWDEGLWFNSNVRVAHSVYAHWRLAELL